MNADLIPILPLLLLLSVIAAAVLMIGLSSRWRSKQAQAPGPPEITFLSDFSSSQHVFLHRPNVWLAVRSRNLMTVQAALGLNNPKPCTWIEGLATEQKVFIGPPVHGWILIVGSVLPDPTDDVDACFRFVVELSRKLGHVQYFSANRVLNHHAWVRAESGRVVRAYAWADRTLWNQGQMTSTEQELGLKCFQYFESPEPLGFGQPDMILSNTEKVPMLAARWSLDPASIDERAFPHAGIAGEPPRF